MSKVDPKTNYEFEVYYPAHSSSPEAEREDLMGMLGPVLQELLAEKDSAAHVAVSNSPKGGQHKLVELSTTLGGDQIAEILQALSLRHGVIVNALE
jgi:hypothetical protein